MMAVKIQEQLARAGVLVTLRTLEMKALVTRCSAGDYDAYLGGWTIPGKIDLQPIFGSDARPPNGSNVVAFQSPEVDGLLRRLDEAEDRQAMQPLLEAIQRRIHEEQPYTFLYEAKRIAALGPRLGGMQIDDPADPLAALERCWLRRS
jgi:ABC-type transport system substrate-binding protein